MAKKLVKDRDYCGVLLPKHIWTKIILKENFNKLKGLKQVIERELFELAKDHKEGAQGCSCGAIHAGESHVIGVEPPDRVYKLADYALWCFVLEEIGGKKGKWYSSPGGILSEDAIQQVFEKHLAPLWIDRPKNL